MWVPQGALFRLEPYGGKLPCAVLRGTRSLVTGFWGGNAPRLLDLQAGFFDFFQFLLEGKKSKNPAQLLPWFFLLNVAAITFFYINLLNLKYTLKVAGQ